jgi:hypothetical protein
MKFPKQTDDIAHAAAAMPTAGAPSNTASSTAPAAPLASEAATEEINLGSTTPAIGSAEAAAAEAMRSLADASAADDTVAGVEQGADELFASTGICDTLLSCCVSY